MEGGLNGRTYECLVVDLNTQHDFCDANGIDPVANIRELIPALRHVIAWAKRNQAPVASSIESRRPSEISSHGGPVCCLDGSNGQKKIDFTLFCHCIRVDVDNTLSCPIELFRTYQQLIFRKRTEDLLTNPKADRLFTQFPAREFVLFGVGIERAIKALGLSLLAREKRVTIVVDACGYWESASAAVTLRQIAAKGACLTSVSKLLRRRLDRSWRYPGLRRSAPSTSVEDPLPADDHSEASVRSRPDSIRLPSPPTRDTMRRKGGASRRKRA